MSLTSSVGQYNTQLSCKPLSWRSLCLSLKQYNSTYNKEQSKTIVPHSHDPAQTVTVATSAPIAGYVDLSLFLLALFNNETCKILFAIPRKQFHKLIDVPGLSFVTSNPVIEISTVLVFRYLHTVFSKFPLSNYLFFSITFYHFPASRCNQPKQSR